MASPAEIRSEIEGIVDEHWRPEVTLRDWWGVLAERGLTFPHWPAPYGRGWSGDQLTAWHSALTAAGVIGPPPGLGTLMGGPVTLDHGTDRQCVRFLPGLAAGTSAWCQLFSEPGAGSDLAGLTTTAERDGDDWVVSGQKVWTSGSVHADHGMLIARTNWDVPKHRGVSYFILPMDQPGVEIRPLRQMNGASHFSEVFLTEARVPDANRLGDVGAGWALATATLGYERRGLGAPKVPGPLPEPGEIAGNLDRTVGDLVVGHRSAGGRDATAAGSMRRLARVAAAHGRIDAIVRDRLAALAAREGVEADVARRQPLAAKLAWTERLRAASDLATSGLGADAMLTDVDDPAHADVRESAGFFLSVPSASIAGGTDEIQRNILGERALGLPREPSNDRDQPFREVPRNA